MTNLKEEEGFGPTKVWRGWKRWLMSNNLPQGLLGEFLVEMLGCSNMKGLMSMKTISSMKMKRIKSPNELHMLTFKLTMFSQLN